MSDDNTDTDTDTNPITTIAIPAATPAGAFDPRDVAYVRGVLEGLGWDVAHSFDPNQHIMQLKGNDYLQVAWRLLWFVKDQRAMQAAGVAKRGFSIRAHLMKETDTPPWAEFEATVVDCLGNEAIMTGSESAKDFGDYREKAATKAVGRALLVLGYGTAAAADELDEADRVVDSPIQRRPSTSTSSPSSRSTPSATATQQQRPQPPEGPGNGPNGGGAPRPQPSAAAPKPSNGTAPARVAAPSAPAAPRAPARPNGQGAASAPRSGLGTSEPAATGQSSGGDIRQQRMGDDTRGQVAALRDDDPEFFSWARRKHFPMMQDDDRFFAAATEFQGRHLLANREAWYDDFVAEQVVDEVNAEQAEAITTSEAIGTTGAPDPGLVAPDAGGTETPPAAATSAAPTSARTGTTASTPRPTTPKPPSAPRRAAPTAAAARGPSASKASPAATSAAAAGGPTTSLAAAGQSRPPVAEGDELWRPVTADDPEPISKAELKEVSARTQALYDGENDDQVRALLAEGVRMWGSTRPDPTNAEVAGAPGNRMRDIWTHSDYRRAIDLLGRWDRDKGGQENLDLLLGAQEDGTGDDDAGATASGGAVAAATHLTLVSRAS